MTKIIHVGPEMGAGGLLHAESLWMGLPSRRAVCCQRCSFLCHLPMLCEIERILDVEAWSAQGHLTSSAGTQPDPDLLSYLSGAPQTAPTLSSFRFTQGLPMSPDDFVYSTAKAQHFKVILRHAILSLD